MVSATKDPVKVRAGMIGAATRWGPPRVVRLGDLTGPQRALIVSLIDAVREAAPSAVSPTATSTNTPAHLRRAPQEAQP